MALLAAVISLKPTRPLPEFLGRAAQAWLLDTIRQSDPALARALHDKGGQDRRPYTVTVIIPRTESEALPWLRLTSLSPELTSHLEQVFLPHLQGSLILAGVEIEIVNVTLDAHAHPWAGNSDYELLARATFDRAASELNQGFKPRVKLR